MTTRFELFIAGRYLRAKRKQAVIGTITILSVLGVAAGVMALVVALAVNNGFRSTLQRNLLGATAHVNLLEKTPGRGIQDWRSLGERLRGLPGVVNVSPSLYSTVYFSGGARGTGAVLKGVPVDPPHEIAQQVREGSFEALKEGSRLPGLLIGLRMSEETGTKLGAVVRVMTEQGELTPMGPIPSWRSFRIVGLYDTGFYDHDRAWAYTSLTSAQKLLSLGDVVNSIEIRLADIYQAPEIARQAEQIGGPRLAATSWMETNRELMNALRMEKTVTVITIGLIQLVAALNIFIALVMMTMEKYRDIAILMSMGARRQQIRRIFMLQGVLIGVVGAALGLISGHVICYFADRYRWLTLDQTVYSLSFVPFEPRPLDSLWIAAGAILVSFVATIYPAAKATRIAPVEALRYE